MTAFGCILKSVPWDVWVAIALAVGVGLTAIFDPEPAVVLAVYIALGGYIVVEIVSKEFC